MRWYCTPVEDDLPPEEYLARAERFHRLAPALNLAAMDELSTNAYRAYRALVSETQGFERYYWESTVIGESRDDASGSSH